MVKILKINILIENDRLEFKLTKYKIGADIELIIEIFLNVKRSQTLDMRYGCLHSLLGMIAYERYYSKNE